jgi:hypothetical protein
LLKEKSKPPKDGFLNLLISMELEIFLLNQLRSTLNQLRLTVPNINHMVLDTNLTVDTNLTMPTLNQLKPNLLNTCKWYLKLEVLMPLFSNTLKLFNKLVVWRPLRSFSLKR